MLPETMNIIEMDRSYYAVVEMKSYEDMGSCAYSRDYKIIPLSLKDNTLLDLYELDSKNARTLEIHGETKLPFEDLPIYLELESAKRNERGLVYEYKVKGNSKWKKVLDISGRVEIGVAHGTLLLENIDILEESVADLFNYTGLGSKEVEDILNGEKKVKITVEIKEKQY